MRIVVLSAAGDVIERIVVINRYLIKLGQRQVRAKQPRFAVIIRSVNASIAAHQQEVFVGWMKRYGMVVNVLVASFDIHPGFSVVFTSHEVIVCLIQHAKAMWVCPKFLVIVGPCSTRYEVIGFGPAGALVIASPETAFASGQFDRGVDKVVLLR